MNPDGTERLDLRGDLVLDVGVLIDGVKRTDVIEACEEEGWAEVLVRDAAGKLVEVHDDKGRGLGPATKRISCKVEFILPDKIYPEPGVDFPVNAP